MKRPIIHFAPANSFPARSYDKLFALLEPDFQIGYLDLHAHNPEFPVTDGWKFLARELETEIRKRYSAPIIGVGHSLGGILHFLNAIENPELYQAIVLLDAPLTSRLSGALLRNIKRFGFIDNFAPSKIALKRRREWESKIHANEHFKRKFAEFDQEMIGDYVEHGTTPNENGAVKLLFKPEIEAHIYRTIPDNYNPFRNRLLIPAAYIGGTNSREARLARLGYMRRCFPFQFDFVEGTHHFPFERPTETARQIKQTINQLIAF